MVGISSENVDLQRRNNADCVPVLMLKIREAGLVKGSSALLSESGFDREHAFLRVRYSRTGTLLGTVLVPSYTPGTFFFR
jgi:hypothetical protein